MYCHFSDKKPENKKISLTELDSILGKDCNEFSKEVKEDFLLNFTLQFSENYLEQFNNVIQSIKQKFSCSDTELAIMYHSILHSKLMQIAVLRDKKDRIIDFTKLKFYLESVDKTIYFKAYEFYNSKEKYEKLIKREFFTSNNPNISNYQRLFIVEVANGFTNADMIDLIIKLRSKYYKKSKSPAPFIIFECADKQSLINLKIDLADKDIHFTNGTLFDGDKFRLSSFKTDIIKIIREENILEVYNNIKFDEVFYFASNFTNNHKSLISHSKFIKIQISENQQLLKIL